MTTTFNRRRALELVTYVTELASTTETDGDSRPVAASVMLPSSGVSIPVATAAMDGVKLASVNVANNKCATVLAYACNTGDLNDYDEVDVINAAAACSFFCSWEGGIRVYDSFGTLICALAVSGRSAKGDRILAARAAADLGYKTDFDADGLTEEEAQRAATGRLNASRMQAALDERPATLAGPPVPDEC